MSAPIVLWAVPRSVSTAFERVMRARGDLEVFSEPFSEPYYFGEQRVSERYAGRSAGGRAADPAARGGSAPDCRGWRGVTHRLMAAAEAGPVFVKDMAYHVAPCLERELLAGFRSTFILRHPGHSLRSLVRKLPDFTREEAGFDAQLRLMTLVAEACEEVVAIDGEELRRAPRAVVEDYCRRVGLPFRPESLTWEAGLVPDWSRWEEWHGEAAQSTGIEPPRVPGEPTRPEGVDPELYASCLDRYERMLELAGGARPRGG